MSIEKSKNINDELLTEEEAFIKHERLIWVAIKKLIPIAESKGIDKDDLYGVGCIGFINAYRRFESDRGYRFSTYAVKTIWGVVMQFVNRYSPGPRVSRGLSELATKALECEDKSLKEMSELLDTSIEELSLAINSRQPVLSFEYTSFTNDADKNLTLQEVLPVEEDFTKAYVDEFLDLLSERDRMLIHCRMKGMSQQEISDEMNISQAHISRVLKKIGKDYLSKQE